MAKKDKPKSQYTGVSWDTRAQKWKVTLYTDYTRVTGGYHHDEKEAAKMYDRLAIKHNKPTNFLKPKAELADASE